MARQSMPGGTKPNVPPGSYVIREVSQSGWTCDYPGTGASCQHSVTLGPSNVNSAGSWELGKVD